MPWCLRLSSLDPDCRSQAISDRIPQGTLHLLEHLGWSCFDDWWTRWAGVGGLDLARNQWVIPVSDDWIAFVALPLLSRVEMALKSDQQVVLGISALPGCGKSTLCSWVKSASEQLGWPVEHLSLDDYYWPSQQLEDSMRGNPWSVPRALPGSHDIDELLRSFLRWKDDGRLTAPRFDKSLRNGRGDRNGTSDSSPSVVLLEGWFLGATPRPSIETEVLDALSDEELLWRSRSICLLRDYQSVWSLLSDLWHLRALQSNQSSQWKLQQLTTLEQQSGVGYNKRDLADFNRMVLAAIPPSWLHQLEESSVVMDLAESRNVREVHVMSSQLSASSSSATG